MAIKVTGLSKAVSDVLRDYRDDVAQAAKKAVKTTAKACREELWETSPKRYGDYRDSWTVQHTEESASSVRAMVYNKDHYQRTHLLEDGHATPQGGFVPGIPHIQPAADNAAELLEKTVVLEVGKA